MDIRLIEIRDLIPAMALAIVFALPAQAQSIEQWCTASRCYRCYLRYQVDLLDVLSVAARGRLVLPVILQSPA
jgi:hypothetical protein